jgi:hypothetical protein
MPVRHLNSFVIDGSRTTARRKGLILLVLRCASYRALLCVKVQNINRPTRSPRVELGLMF